MSRFFLEWLCGTPLVWQFDEKVRNFHCKKRFSQRGNLEAIYFGSSPVRVGTVGPFARLIPLQVLLRKLRILVFFLHRRSQRRADMPYCLPFFTCPYGCPLCAYAAHAQACCVVFPPLFRACKARSLLAGCRALWKVTGQCFWRTPAPGGFDAIAAIKHALERDRIRKKPACTCAAKVHLES